MLRSILCALIAFSFTIMPTQISAFGGTSGGSSSGSSSQGQGAGQPGGGLDIYQSNRGVQKSNTGPNKAQTQRRNQGHPSQGYSNRYPYQSWQDRDARD